MYNIYNTLIYFSL